MASWIQRPWFYYYLVMGVYVSTIGSNLPVIEAAWVALPVHSLGASTLVRKSDESSKWSYIPAARVDWSTVTTLKGQKRSIFERIDEADNSSNHKSLKESSSTTRRGWLGVSLGTILMILTDTAAPADAADGITGTKKDPSFEACLSKCMYQCTKPKGAEQKSRLECLPECKKQCATTKAQLMIGVPLPPQ